MKMLNNEIGEIPTIVMGTFDPETRWRDPNLTRLPAMPDKDREAIVLCMDELLFPFCRSDDVLYSRCKVDPILHEYLNGLSFSFQSRSHYDLNDEKEPLPEADVFKQCMFKLATEQAQPPNRAPLPLGSGYSERFVLLESSNPEVTRRNLSPYAITSDTEHYLQAAGPFGALPDLETVVRVNSKMYSNRLMTRIGEKSYGTEVYNAAEVEATGSILLKRGPYLLKDPYGVSGKGNLLIDSEAMQRRIMQHLLKQEAAGWRSEFLIEPLLLKEADFSSHWFIKENGEKEFISIQRMMNHQQNYSGSIQADEAFISLIDNAGYFDIIEKALRLLAEDGYHGFVCFDSMILKDGKMVSIVEINARKSMGLINAYLDRHWKPYNLTSWLTFLSIGLPEGFTIEKLLKALRVSGLLCTSPGAYGIVPLSSNTIMVNEIITRRYAAGTLTKRSMPKGRLYASVLGRNDEHRNELIESLRQILADLSVKVYN